MEYYYYWAGLPYDGVCVHMYIHARRQKYYAYILYTGNYIFSLEKKISWGWYNLRMYSWQLTWKTDEFNYIFAGLWFGFGSQTKKRGDDWCGMVHGGVATTQQWQKGGAISSDEGDIWYYDDDVQTNCVF